MGREGVVDLRSDTVTRPTAAMRAAMAAAEVGDDVFGEDPTVNRLQEVFAELVGTEAALFVPSGTMGNQLCLRLLTEPGDEVVVGREQHVVRWEEGATVVNARVRLTLVDDGDGTIVVPDGSAAALVCIEDTHLGSGGRPWPEAALRRVASAGRPIHLDGARLWHAAVASGTTPADRVAAAGATTVTCCLSKALGAPVGSVVGMPAAMVDEARRERRRLGGAMRQAGVLAAAGLVALRDHQHRLAADHARARLLADACAERWPGSVDTATVVTNVVMAEVGDAVAECHRLAAMGVLALPFSPTTLRLVTHGDVDDDGIDRAVAALGHAPPDGAGDRQAHLRGSGWVRAGAVAYLRPVASAQLVDDVPSRALAVYAHPDDVEVACGGTLARWARAGCETHLVVVCQGDKGSVDPATDPAALAATRAQEVADAADVLGLATHRLLGIPDGEVEATATLMAALVAAVRSVRAEVVIAPDPTAVLFGRRYVNHRDHRVVGTAAMDAVAPAAAMPHYFPTCGPAWTVRELWLSGTLEPDVHVDVAPVLDVKAAALACHRSQVDVPGELLHSVVQQRAQDAGRSAGIRYAESFRRMLLA